MIETLSYLNLLIIYFLFSLTNILITVGYSTLFINKNEILQDDNHLLELF